MRLPILYVRLAPSGSPSIAGLMIHDGEEHRWSSAYNTESAAKHGFQDLTVVAYEPAIRHCKDCTSYDGGTQCEADFNHIREVPADGEGHCHDFEEEEGR